ncbi:MAG: hypothetical protein V9G19_14885 [Tetrasphaera sp.]
MTGPQQAWGGSITVGGSEALSPDRSQQYYSHQRRRPTSANSNYTNPRIFELWNGARAEPDDAKRDEMYHELALHPERGSCQWSTCTLRTWSWSPPRTLGGGFAGPPQRARVVHERRDLDARTGLLIAI